MKDMEKEIKKANKKLNKLIDEVNKQFDKGEGYILLETKKGDSHISTHIKGDKQGISYCLKSLFSKLIRNDVVPVDILIALVKSCELEIMMEEGEK